MIKKEQIHFRDPFLVPDNKGNLYYMYGTPGKYCWEGHPDGFDAYTSRDLINWEGPFPVFRPSSDFWAHKHFWSPEV